MSHQIRQADLDGLRKKFNCQVIGPNDPEYDEARAIFNAMIDRRPGVIAQCAHIDDVVRAVRFGRERGLELAIRGGGHSVAGNALTDGGLVIDLRRMNTVSVDPEARSAVVGGGWLDRKFGLACDNLLSVELVTADGSIVVANDDENPELFWALHDGGNFGVATSFASRLHALPSVTAALLLWRPEAGPGILRTYRDFMASAPDEVGGGLIYLTGPAEPFVPAHLVDKLTLAVLVVYAGREVEAREVASSMLALGHEGELIAEMPYAELQCMLDDPPGYRNYWSAEYLDALPDEAIDLFCTRANDMIVPSASQHVLFPQGGAVGRGPVHYPLPWRRAPWVFHPFGLWLDPADDERARRWAHDIRADLKQWSSGAGLPQLHRERG